jgi:hypothetical protein
MSESARKLTVLSKNPAVIVERKMSCEEARMYQALRDYRCHQGQSAACPARIIIGQAGVVLECPTCGWTGQTYPDAGAD